MAAPARDEYRVNDRIEAAQVRLVDEEGNMVGVVGIGEALRRADEAGLDLVEIAASADPPVCKILDLGKFKYESQKKANAARKKQRVIEVKEIKMRPSIDPNDYNIKMKKVQNFLEEGDKVKLTMRFRGREMAHQDLALRLLERVRDDVGALAKIEQMPKMEGRQMVMVMAPAK
ncbi:MAG TPA: translation initiation factor IF-3 [Geminicoccaceae bacterium]|nr:translation initiation factor IF-3 [Geminicoccaceae bacterium]